MRVRRPRRGDEGGSSGGSPDSGEHEIVQLDEDQLGQLSAVFSAPRWLRDLGLPSWLLVGVIFLLVGLILLVGATSEITQPVTAAFVVACVTLPLVRRLAQHRVGRAGAAGIALLLLLVPSRSSLVGVLVIGGITSQADDISASASSAADKVQGWLRTPASTRRAPRAQTTRRRRAFPQGISTLVNGLVTGIGNLTSLALALSFVLLSLFFLLKDGPSLRAWVEGHMRLAPNPLPGRSPGT